MKLAASPRVQKVFVAPGTAGTAREAGAENVAITDLEALADFAAPSRSSSRRRARSSTRRQRRRSLPERGLRIFGPTKAAARLESSKTFAKSFLVRHGIPTAGYESFTDARAAHAYVDARGAPIVVKADGLAAGKGVVVAATAAEAHAAIDRILVDRAIGEAGRSS